MCNDESYKDVFKLNTYKKYIRDTSFEDEEIYDMIKDIFTEISYETRVFKDIFIIKVTKDIDIYNIKKLYYDYLKIHNKKYIEFTNNLDISNLSEDSIQKYLIDPSKDNKKINECINVFKGILSIELYDANKNIVTELPNNFFKKIDDYTFKLNYNLHKKDNYYIILKVSILPNISNIDTNVEVYCRNVIISGLKYYANSAYTSMQNDQGTNLLYQRFYNSKKQLMLEFNNYIENVKLNNPDWNN